MASNGERPADDLLESKKRVVTERLQKRDGERQAGVQQRQDEKSLTDAADENVTSFQKTFTNERDFIEAALEKCQNMDKVSLAEHFDLMSDKHTKLCKYVAESTLFLSSHEVGKAQATLAKLQVDIQGKRDQLIPKKKFAFKTKRSEKSKEITAKDEVDHAAPKQVIEVELAACKFVKQDGLTLEKGEDELNQKDVALADLSNCTVKLTGAPSAIHVNKLRNCKIFSGPVSGSVFIRDCKDCIFLVPCQQLRIHTTTDTDFYIHVTSKAIIEDCNDVHFAPYNLNYPKLDSHYIVSGLDKSRNNWDDVDDFNWLAADVHSPNWSVIPANKRQTWNL